VLGTGGAQKKMDDTHDNYWKSQHPIEHQVLSVAWSSIPNHLSALSALIALVNPISAGTSFFYECSVLDCSNEQSMIPVPVHEVERVTDKEASAETLKRVDRRPLL